MFVCQTLNDYGTTVDQFRCETCGDLFTVCPPMPDRTRDDEWRGCMSPQCASYDPARDADKLFDDGNVVSLAGRRVKVRRGPPASSGQGTKPNSGE